MMGVTGLLPDADTKSPPVTAEFIVSLPPAVWLGFQYVVLPQPDRAP